MSCSESGVERTKPRILIVDDHPLVRAGLAALIQAEPDLEVCGETGAFSGALELFRETEPDLAIVDLSLAEGSGLELVRRLTAPQSRTRVLVCSMHEESLFAQRALNAGAMGYINKQEATSNVIEAIRRVLSGKIYLSGSMTERLLNRITARGSSVKAMPSIRDLSDRELEVFDLIGRGLSSSQIAEQLHLSVKTVEAHRAKIKRKLNLGSGRELTRYAVQWALEQR
ncbi:MAG: response regulator transcription factor [Chromatiaceae bacterium]|jgi:DNA-binding NarL/FixJ family response regulator